MKIIILQLLSAKLMSKRKPALLFIFITLLVDVIGIGIIIPVMPQLIKSLVGGSMSDASVYGGWLMFAFAIMQFLFSPIFGGLSDQFGRRPVLLISLLGFGLDYILLALAPTITWLFIGRILAGITGASFTTATAYIADVSEPEKRAQNFGMIGAAFGLGFIIGPVIGGLLGQFGERIPFYAAAGITLLNWLYGFFVLPESLDKANRRPFDWKRANPIGSLLNLSKYPMLSGLVFAMFFVFVAGHAVQSVWSFFTIERFGWDQAMVGYSLGVVGVLVAFVQGFLIRYSTPKLGPKKSVYFGLMLYSIGLLLFAFANQSWMMFTILIPYCLGGIAGPALQAVMSNQVPANEQGELQGALTSMMSLTSIIGPLLMTYLFSHFTQHGTNVYFPGAPFLVGAAFMFVSMILVMRTFKRNEIK
jgi:DHA1 family tetracycline resistance protein-like MFS transporter